MNRRTLLVTILLLLSIVFLTLSSFQFSTPSRENSSVAESTSLSASVQKSNEVVESRMNEMSEKALHALPDWAAPIYTQQDRNSKGVDMFSYVDLPFNKAYTIARASDNMVLVPGGNIEINSGYDPIWGDSIPTKLVAISPFWMSETEVTNRQYREFVFYVRDSVVRERLYDSELGDDQRYRRLKYNKRLQRMEDLGINWRRKIPWSNPDPAQSAAIVSVLSGAPFAEGLKTDLLNYKYDWFDNKSYFAALIDLRKKGVESITISKDTAYFDEDDNVIRETIVRTSEGNPIDFTNTYIVNIYPDVYSWMTDFSNAKNEQYMKKYFVAPGFDNHPVVGISWEQADAFCAWKSDMYKQRTSRKDQVGMEDYRLPTEAEWTFAARNGLSELRYPWLSEKATTIEGLALANFRGSIDLKDLISPVATYYPNMFGLYDMAGNVAEWTSTSYSESVDLMSDVVNPDYSYRARASDPAIMKRKVVKGGSWKDTETFTRSDLRSQEYQDKGRSYIGFRLVRSWGLDKRGEMILK